MQTIYLDVLIVLNIYVNFFLLFAAAWLTHSPVRKKRFAAASAYGSLFSLLILAPPLPDFFSFIIRSFAAVSIVLLAFGYSGKKRLFLNTAAFFASNFILAGMVNAVYSWAAPELIHFNNGSFYIDFSLLILVLTTAAMYLIFRIIRIIFDKSPDSFGSYKVIVRYKEKIVSMDGIADTGNGLVDHFTGAPVIVCGEENFGTGHIQPDSLPHGMRLLPCSTISESGMIPVFRPDEVLIVCTENGEKKAVDALIGLGRCSEGAVFNPKLLKN